MKKTFFNLFFIGISMTFYQCDKSKDNPSPQQSSSSTSGSGNTVQVVTKANVNNSFSLGNGNTTTYHTTLAAEEAAVTNGKNVYILIIDSPGSAFVEFWFNSKPSIGTYSVEDILVSYTNGVSSGSVGIAAKVSNIYYYSQGVGSITVSQSGGNYIVTASNVILADASSNAKSLSCTVTIP